MADRVRASTTITIIAIITITTITIITTITTITIITIRLVGQLISDCVTHALTPFDHDDHHDVECDDGCDGCDECDDEREGTGVGKTTVGRSV